MTRRLDDTWTNWSPPQNLGDSVNTDGLDACFTIAASGKEGFLISTKNSLGQGDVFSVRVPEKAKPLPVVLVSGRVLDKKTSKPLTAEIRYYDLATDTQIGSAVSDPRTGKYSIVLQSGRKYSFRAEVAGFFAINENLDLSVLKEYREVAQDLMLAPIEKGQTIRLNNLFFDTGRSDLRSESRSELNRVVELMKGNPTLTISIEGHTDSVGEDAANLVLSEQRAKAVKDFLISAGIGADRLKSRGFGRTKPVGPNDSDEGRAQNRRVEFTIGE
jgi:outer membrane protein OmpA-like peptidoglycan-associated protein